MLCQYSNEYIRHSECGNNTTPYMLYWYSNECIFHYKWPHGATP